MDLRKVYMISRESEWSSTRRYSLIVLLLGKPHWLHGPAVFFLLSLFYIKKFQVFVCDLEDELGKIPKYVRVAKQLHTVYKVSCIREAFCLFSSLTHTHASPREDSLYPDNKKDFIPWNVK